MFVRLRERMSSMSRFGRDIELLILVAQEHQLHPYRGMAHRVSFAEGREVKIIPKSTLVGWHRYYWRITVWSINKPHRLYRRWRGNPAMREGPIDDAQMASTNNTTVTIVYSK